MNCYLGSVRPFLAVLLCVIAISGCQSLPAAPEHKYYRLLTPTASTSAAQHVHLPGELVVRSLRADGLYSERAIVFSDQPQQRQLQQYHYQHWLYPPAQLPG